MTVLVKHETHVPSSEHVSALEKWVFNTLLELPTAFVYSSLFMY